MSGTVVESFGHRGARGLEPENTLIGFDRALRIGVHGLELDVGMSADGEVVVYHDPVLNPDITRDAQGRWLRRAGPALIRLTLAELRRLDVGGVRPGSAYARRFAHQRQRPGTTIPTLAEVLTLALRAEPRPPPIVDIEVKLSPLEPGITREPEQYVDAVLACLLASGIDHDRVVIRSFDWRVLRCAQRASPALATAYLSHQSTRADNIGASRPDPSPWTAGLAARDFAGSVPRMVNAAGGRIWSPHFRDLDRASLAAAHELGLRVVVWTVNAPREMRRLIRMGVDGIISDYPDRLRDALQAARAPLPPSRTPGG